MKTFTIKGKVWRYKGDGPWHFVYVNKELSQKIRDTARNNKKATSFVRIKATIGKTSWQTSLFPTKDGPYVLCIKAEIRAKEGITDGNIVTAVCNLL